MEKEKEEKKKSKLKEAQEQLAEEKDKYLRLAAEFDNYRRRTAKERLELISTAGEKIFTDILPILDDCERALAVLQESDDSKAAKEGTELIYNKLFAFLKSNGINRIEALGQEFNTDFHEAVAQFPVEESEKKNMIIDVVQNGYTLNGKVIRFAKVVVGI
ncbi:MAG: nucleotide exchange factor GrpE [Bacteroidales bacterium]|nr:nucleotide exchange factor GrpE [Bacteroidales bacterium]